MVLNRSRWLGQRLCDVGLLFAVKCNHSRMPGAKQKTFQDASVASGDRNRVTRLSASSQAVANLDQIRALNDAPYLGRVRTFGKQQHGIDVGLCESNAEARKKDGTQFPDHALSIQRERVKW